MNAIATTHPYGELIEPTSLKIERLLPGPIERVWAYLTESELRKRWLAAGDMKMQVGAAFEFVWRNDALSPTPAKRPEGFAEEMRMASRITALEPPRKIAFTWEGSGDVTFELAPKGSQVLLTIIHCRLPDRATLLKVAGGWHMHLEYLTAHAGGKPVPDGFWEGWKRLHDEYDRRLPA